MIAPAAQDRLTHRLQSSEIVPLGALFLLTVAVYWKIALTDQFTWMDGSDTAFQVLPWLQEQVRQWKTGHFPLWEPHHWAGQSLIGLMQPGVVYPLNWLLALFPLDDQHHISIPVLNWYFIAIHYMGVAFCYALCRDLKASRAAAMLTSISFGLCGYLGTNVWPQMMNGVVWAPLIFLFLLRALRGGRMWFHAAVAGACAGVALLSGHHQAPSFIALAAGVTLLFFGFSRSASWGRVIFSGLTFAVFTVAVAAVQILPSREYYQHAFRWVGSQDPVMFGQKVPYIAHMVLSFNPVSLFGIVVPGVEANITPFIGITILSLAIIAVMEGWERLEVRLFALLSVFGILLCLGQWSILQGLVYVLLPGMDKARNASFAILVFQFAAAVLAGFGLDILLARTARLAWLNIAMVALGFGGFLYLALIARFAFEPHTAIEQTGVGLAALNAVLLGALLLLWFHGRLSKTLMTWGVIALTLFEIGNVTGSPYRHREQGWPNLNRLRADRDVVGFLREHLGDGRFDANTADMPVNLGDWEGLDQFNGYTGITTNIVGIAFDPNSRRLFGVRYYVSIKPRLAGQEPVFRGASGLNVFAEPEPLPPAWSVKRLEEVSDERLFPGKLAASSPDELRSNGFIARGKKPALDICEGEDAVVFRKIRATSYRVDADMKCKRMVIVGNDYFPGWTVRIDGKETEMYEVDRALQGFVVPAGKHRVEVAYRPRSVYAGAAITIAGFLGVLGLWLRRSYI